MRAVERYGIIEALLPLLVPLSESEVDAMIRNAGSGSTTPVGWESQDPATKGTELRTILSLQSDNVLTQLNEFLPEDKRAPVTVGLQIPDTGGPLRDEPIEVVKQHPSEGPIFVVHGPMALP